VDYIDAAACLRTALSRKSQIEADIADLRDKVLSAGIRAVQPYRTNAEMDGYREGPPMSVVVEALKFHRLSIWGKALPDGLCSNDLSVATGLGDSEIEEGIKALQGPGHDALTGWVLLRSIECGFERWRLIERTELANDPFSSHRRWPSAEDEVRWNAITVVCPFPFPSQANLRKGRK
jgi:hypothetical protein